MLTGGRRGAVVNDLDRVVLAKRRQLSSLGVSAGYRRRRLRKSTRCPAIELSSTHSALFRIYVYLPCLAVIVAISADDGAA